MSAETAPKKPEIKITAKRQNMTRTASQRAPRPKASNFLLTINTNQQYKDGDNNLENDIEVFDATIQQILNHIDDYVRLPEGDAWSDDKIRDVNIDYVIEKGHKRGQIHAHIMIKIKHFSKVLLNYEKIKAKICGDLGLDNVYMLNKLIRNSGSDNIIDYLDKYT
jgi:hypothetical protein